MRGGPVLPCIHPAARRLAIRGLALRRLLVRAPAARRLAVPAAILLGLALASCAADRERRAAAPEAREVAPRAIAPSGPDVAPDTSFVVFTAVEDGRRDVFRLDTASGAVRPLTRSAEDESHPRISPDGTRVAFLRETDAGPSVWIAGADGAEPLRVATAAAPLSGPAWSPDGARLLVASAGRLFLAAASGGDTLEAAPWPAPEGAADPAWGPDGTVVVSAPGDGGTDLFLVDAAGAAPPARITRTPAAEEAPRYRDGRLLYVARDGGRGRLFVMRRVPNGFGPAEPVPAGGRDVLSAAFWPGSDRVLAAERGGWAVVARDLAGGLPITAVPPDANNTDPVFDASGENIFYTSDTDGNEEIYVVELTDFTVANLTTGIEADYQPDFSAALGRLVFVTEREGNPDILSIDESGLDDLFLTHDPAADTEPRFSPDGRWVAFVSDRAGSPDIWVVPSGGGEPQRITTNDAGAERSPTWVDAASVARFGHHPRTGDGRGALTPEKTDAALVFEANWDGPRALMAVELTFGMAAAESAGTTGAGAVPGGGPTVWSSWAARLPGETEGAESIHPMADLDGRQVGYTRLGGGDADLWVLDLDTGDRAALVTDPRTNQDNLSWSGDAARITYQDGGAVRLVLRALPEIAGTP